MALTSIEAGSEVREGNGANSISDGVTAQSRAQYGRVVWGAAQQVAEVCDLRRHETFVDIGSGVGNTVMQMACTIGCDSRGIELMERRVDTGHLFWDNIKTVISEREGGPVARGDCDDCRRERRISASAIFPALICAAVPPRQTLAIPLASSTSRMLAPDRRI